MFCSIGDTQIFFFLFLFCCSWCRCGGHIPSFRQNRSGCRTRCTSHAISCPHGDTLRSSAEGLTVSSASQVAVLLGQLAPIDRVSANAVASIQASCEFLSLLKAGLHTAFRVHSGISLLHPLPPLLFRLQEGEAPKFDVTEVVIPLHVCLLFFDFFRDVFVLQSAVHAPHSAGLLASTEGLFVSWTGCCTVQFRGFTEIQEVRARTPVSSCGDSVGEVFVVARVDALRGGKVVPGRHELPPDLCGVAEIKTAELDLAVVGFSRCVPVFCLSGRSLWFSAGSQHLQNFRANREDRRLLLASAQIFSSSPPEPLKHAESFPSAQSVTLFVVHSVC
mmetsp:Transcript_38617/g.75844  ORF Transcript_38617/g.75844 Transcript_38617/m.75844 type:complete len:333 (+) Transcript_38617:1577-2575(+)